MPLSDMIDRLTIFKLKMDRLPNSDLIAELFGIYAIEVYSFIKNQSTEFITVCKSLSYQLYEANKAIWNLERDIRNGTLVQDKNFKEIGRRATQIRKYNKIRTDIKNQIARLCGETCGIDKKVDHGSE